MPGVRAAALGSMCARSRIRGGRCLHDSRASTDRARHGAARRALPDGRPRILQRIADTAVEAGASLPARIAPATRRRLLSAISWRSSISLGENPLGKHLRVAARGNADYEIVGVVADTLYQVGQPSKADHVHSPFSTGRVIREGSLWRCGRRPIRWHCPFRSRNRLRSSIRSCRFPMCLPCSRSLNGHWATPV